MANIVLVVFRRSISGVYFVLVIHCKVLKFCEKNNKKHEKKPIDNVSTCSKVLRVIRKNSNERQEKRCNEIIIFKKIAEKELDG